MTDYGSRTERWVAGKWPAMRSRGFARFLLVKGMLTWGGVMFITMTIMVTLRLGSGHPRLPLLIALAALLCAIGGAVWAGLTWWLNERIYRSLSIDRNA